jgi:hypothetical protein
VPTQQLCQWLLTIPRICSWGVAALIVNSFLFAQMRP